MQKFTDNAGREWGISVNMKTKAAVMKAAGIDLSKISDPDVAGKLDSPALFWDALIAFVSPQMHRLGVSEESLGEAIDDDVVELAVKAIVLAAIDNLPQRQRDALTRSFQRTWDNMNRERNAAAEIINAKVESGEFDKAVDEALENFFAAK